LRSYLANNNKHIQRIQLHQEVLLFG